MSQVFPTRQDRRTRRVEDANTETIWPRRLAAGGPSAACFRIAPTEQPDMAAISHSSGAGLYARLVEQAPSKADPSKAKPESQSHKN